MYRKLIVDPVIRARHADLVKSPVVVLVQQFNEQGVKDFREDMERAHGTGQPIIPVLIDSYGGSVYGCLDMIGILEKASLPVYTVVNGKAMSAGAILFGMGKRRFMAPNATLMLHDAATYTSGKIEEIKADAKECERLNKLIFGLIARNVGQKENYFYNIIHQKGHADWFMTSKQAKKHKLCTDVGVPELRVKISVDYEFSV